MILECRHCGAPLDVKADVTLTKCRYCGVTSERRLLRTIAQETPRDYHPPKVWVPPPHVAAPSNQPLRYHSGGVRLAIVGSVAAAILGLAVSVAVVGKLRLPGGSGSGVAGAFASGVTPKDLVGVRIDQTQANLARALAGRTAGVMVTVPLKHERYQFVSFLWNKDEPEYPWSFTFVPQSGVAADPRLIEALGSRLHGGLKDGSWSFAGLVSVYADAKTGSVGASIQQQLGPKKRLNPRSKEQLVALWKVVLGAVFGLSTSPTPEESRELLGAPHPFASLATIDPTTPVDKAAETLTRKFPGASATTFINLDIVVSVDHPLLREVELTFRNEKGGTMSGAHMRGTQGFPGRREAFVACLEGKLGKPDLRDRDYVNKKRDYSFTAGKARVHIAEETTNVSGVGQHILPADWAKIIGAVGACR